MPTTSTQPRTLVANASVAFVLAAMVTSLVHELAHAVAGLIVGLVPTVSPFSVSFVPDPTRTQALVTAAAGPGFSLVLGLVLIVVARSWGSGFVRLFWMWLAFMSVMNFVGYLVIAPIAPAGDTGQVLELLSSPTLVTIVLSLVGVAGQFVLARRFAVEVKRYTDGRGEERQLALIGWAIGTPIIVVLVVAELFLLHAAPEHVFPVAMYAVAVGVFSPMQFIFSSRVANTRERLSLRPIPVLALVVTVLTAVALVGLAGAGGLPLG